MATEFELKAMQLEERLASEAEDTEEPKDGETAVSEWIEAYRQKQSASPPLTPSPPPVVVEKPVPPPPQTVALMVMKADATSKDATFAEALVDRTVQFGQPLDAMFTTSAIAVGNLTIIVLEVPLRQPLT